MELCWPQSLLPWAVPLQALSLPRCLPCTGQQEGRTYIVADGGVPVNQSLDVAVNAAARRKLCQRGRMRFFLSLLYNDLAGLPLGHDLLIPESNVFIHLQTDRPTLKLWSSLNDSIKNEWTPARGGLK